MDAGKPRVRHRSFFLHPDTTAETNNDEQENPEAFGVRVQNPRHTVPRQANSTAVRSLATEPSNEGRSRMRVRAADDSDPQIRSGSVTGSRQRVHSPR